MSEHLLAEQVRRYRQRVMSPTELLMADDHLVTCDSCRQRLSETGQGQKAITFLRADLQAEAQAKPNHLLYEQLADYVDDSLDEVDREIVETHLQDCKQCTVELHDLQAFKTAMNTPPLEEPAIVAEPTLWERFVAFWCMPGRWISLQVAAAAVVAAMCVGVGTLLLYRQVINLRAQLGELQQTNAALQKQVSTVSNLEAQLAHLRQQNERNQQDYAAAQTTVAALRTQLAFSLPSFRVPHPKSG
jgi:anti-sigma factor RsiW